MNAFSALHAPLQYIDTLKGVELWLKREDLIHPKVSGNKWRKLKYYLEDFQQSGKTMILTFGGAFSNHLAATAALGKMMGIDTKALVRGEEVHQNPTLDFCRAQGMVIDTLSRKKYATKDDAEFQAALAEHLPYVYVIPEGGKGPLGLKGCTEILEAVPPGFDVVCCAGGTGTTMAGLLAGGYQAHFTLYPALKGGHFLRRAIAIALDAYARVFSTSDHGKMTHPERLSIVEDHHFGGYGKTRPALIRFMNDFYAKYKVPLDPVYTGKMMFGIMEGIQRGQWPEGTKILALHTGGLQGIKGMNARLKKSGDLLLYED